MPTPNLKPPPCPPPTEIIPSADEIRKVVDKIAAGQRRRPVFVFAADGAMAPIRTEHKGPHAWKEAKGIRAYLLDKDHILRTANKLLFSNLEKQGGVIASCLKK